MLTACSLSYKGVFVQGVLCPGRGGLSGRPPRPPPPPMQTPVKILPSFAGGKKKNKDGQVKSNMFLRYFIAVTFIAVITTRQCPFTVAYNQVWINWLVALRDLVQSMPKPSKVRKDRGNRRLVETFVKSFSHAFCFFNRLLSNILRQWAGSRVCPTSRCTGTATGSRSGSRGPRGYL